MNYRFIHTADIHSDADPIKQQKLEASLGQMVDYCKEVKVNAIIIAGDIWEERQNHSDNSGVPLIYTYLRHLSKLVDFIFIVKGNNSHDQPGSISLLHQLEPNIYAFEKPVTLSVDTFADAPVINLLDPLLLNSTFHSDYIVSLIPYPSKSMFIVDATLRTQGR